MLLYYLCLWLRKIQESRDYMSESDKETIKKLEDQIEQLQARKKGIENREKERIKRERTRKLIKFGELCEKYLPYQTPEELEEYFKRFEQANKQLDEQLKEIKPPVKSPKI